MSKIKLSELFEELDRCETSVPVEMLVDRMGKLDLSPEDLEPYVRFADDGYARNLVHLGPGYVALVLCWRSGQMSPIHDHHGSACALRILRGAATEKRYERGPDGVMIETGTSVYAEGSVCGTYDSDTHTVVNHQPVGQDLVTLHVYTPPMRSYNTYDMDGTSRRCQDNEVLAEERRRAEAVNARRPSTDGEPLRRRERQSPQVQ